MSTPQRLIDARLIVFTKAPAAGQAKTRLIPALGTVGAAALAGRLLDHSVAAGVAAGFAAVELCVTPSTAHPAFQRLQARHRRLAVTLQGEGDLGARMDRALTRALQLSPAVLLIGTDAPALDADMLRSAADALAESDAVFVPAFDGGYALVGLRRPAPGLFVGIDWSTDRVMQQTRGRAAAAGLRIIELPAVSDIDEPADLARLPLALQSCLR